MVQGIPAFGEKTGRKIGKGKLGSLGRSLGQCTPSLQKNLEEQLLREVQAAQNRQKAQARAAQKQQKAIEVQVLRNSTNEPLKKARCAKELAKENPSWTPIDIQAVQNNHMNYSKGVMFGLEFPWSEETLVELGPEWLTKALHTAGTLADDNEVISVSVEPMTRSLGGNNGGKFFFEVRYARNDPELHTKLFAKIPFPMTPALKTDRISSSVYKQPMDFCEVNTYRLYEASLPFRTPKFYFGDISIETSNFIIILERLEYANADSNRPGAIRPYQIEGPYDKCKDFQLPGDAKEYYTKIMENSGACAGAHKAGKFGPDEQIAANLLYVRSPSKDLAVWGCNPSANTGQDITSVRNVLDTGYRFISSTAKVLYPDYVTDPAFQEKFMRVLMTVNAYRAEINYWKNCDEDYTALGHMNFNIDNAYFWRDEAGTLHCGGLDWGAFGVNSMPHKLWWCVNCADFDNIRENLEHYIDTFMATCEQYGGPKLSKRKFTQQVIITGLENFLQMVGAVPNCMKMCAAKEWLTIENKHDPRIAGNVDGKSTLRTTLHVIGTGLGLMEELQGDKVVEEWIADYYAKELGLPPKTDAMIGLVVEQSAAKVQPSVANVNPIVATLPSPSVIDQNEDSQLSQAQIVERQVLRQSASVPLRMERCAKEMAKDNPTWTPIGINTVTDNHMKHSKGMFYGLDFPWSEETLISLGPEWLTTAMHEAGTLAKDNKVIALSVQPMPRSLGGNNGAKFFFRVKYARDDPELHTKLFAKIPYPMTPKLKTDRISSSVYKQPMDFAEINTYRVYEASLPFSTPKFYFGDISMETSNFIIILEQLEYANVDTTRPGSVLPYQIEGPYDKCKDFQLLGSAKEYYTKIVRNIGACGGAHKAGKFGTDKDISVNLLILPSESADLAAWGCNPSASTGQDPAAFRASLETGYKFISSTAKVLYPDYVTDPSFKQKYMRLLLSLNAYRAEIQYWKNSEHDYCGLGHMNYNIDNAYFWRDEEGELYCGGLDWGGFGMNSLPHKVWWALNCADVDNIRDNLEHYIDACMASYEEHGGSKLDKKKFTQQVIITGLENWVQMIGAVPNCMRMCAAKEWASIKDRHDPRIADNVDGKSTLRTTLHVLETGLRLFEEMQGDKAVADWITDYYTGVLGLPAKSDDIIGLVAG